ncbi:AraC family transcriptional regulator [Paenibacillus sp. HJL G12]|uniref:AraC family transcriptional regulator n=1 Tax=Paenibacillus dendrobii TaxID=2691084 RepID=A0A7X3IQG3_9BACL|nr:GyrI-like domain-containing protein [Paenibacillus dendrobii]MWV46382.1 AraC family transcriptional regulator [Paenibacillus dendrobii]
MNYEITHMPAVELAGIKIRTSNRRESGPDGLIPSLWEQYGQGGLSAKLKPIHPQLLYALYTEYESDVNGDYTLLLGHERDLGFLGEDAIGIASIPEATYLKFTTQRGPVQQVVIQLWQEIWAFFENSEIKRTYTGDFELYNLQDLNSADAVVDVYIAVEKH